MTRSVVRYCNLISVVLIVLGISLSPPFSPFAWAQHRSGGGSVHVRGYFRKDGTYVSPHYRSAPDGSFYNNWSTKGNVNPYTGKEGTKNDPVSVPHISHSTPIERKASSTHQAISAGSDWLAAQDKAARIRIAAELHKLGRDVDWHQHSYLDMSDQVARIQIARELKGLGYSVRWEDHDYLEMYDWASRIRIARDLSRKGIKVDWRKQSYLEMYARLSKVS